MADAERRQSEASGGNAGRRTLIAAFCCSAVAHQPSERIRLIPEKFEAGALQFIQKFLIIWSVGFGQQEVGNTNAASQGQHQRPGGQSSQKPTSGPSHRSGVFSADWPRRNAASHMGGMPRRGRGSCHVLGANFSCSPPVQYAPSCSPVLSGKWPKAFTSFIPPAMSACAKGAHLPPGISARKTGTYGEMLRKCVVCDGPRNAIT